MVEFDLGWAFFVGFAAGVASTLVLLAVVNSVKKDEAEVRAIREADLTRRVGDGWKND